MIEMKIAIVGSSKVKHAYPFVRNTILKLIDEFGDVEIVSGGSAGIDQDAKNSTTTLRLKYKEFAPKSWKKEDLLERNKDIAKYSDLVISIALPLQSISCYHCKETEPEHEKTAGCYTAKHAKAMGKNIRLIIMPKEMT